MDKPIKIVAHIHGGILQSVVTNYDGHVEVDLIDDDNLEAEGYNDEDRTKIWDEATQDCPHTIF